MKTRAIALAASIILAVVLPTRAGLRLHRADAARPDQAAPRCQNIQLLIRPYTSQGAAGTIAVIYRIHNLKSEACTLYGYPGVQLLDRHFLSLPTTVHRGGPTVGTIPRQVISLAAYGNGYFTLTYSDVPVNNQPCEAPASYLMIFAPDNYLPVVTYAFAGGSITACTGNVNVSPVTSQPRYR